MSESTANSTLTSQKSTFENIIFFRHFIFRLLKLFRIENLNITCFTIDERKCAIVSKFPASSEHI